MTRAPDEAALLRAIGASDPAVRKKALAVIADGEVNPRLIAAAATALQDPDPEVRRAALRVIERAPTAAPFDAIAAAAVDYEPEIRARALVALGRTQRADVLEVIEERLGAESDDPVIGAGLVALGQTLQTIPRPFPASALERVARAVAGISGQTRARHRGELNLVARAIREDDLIEALENEDARVRVGAAALIAERGSESACRALALKDSDPEIEVKELAAWAAEAVRGGSISGASVEAGFDVERYGRRADDIVRRSEKVADPEAVTWNQAEGDPFHQALDRLASDPIAHRAELRKVVELLGSDALCERIERYLDDLHPGRARRVALLLQHLRRTEVIPFLCKALLELPAGEERSEVARVLNGFPHTWQVVAMLQEDPSAERRVKAVKLANTVDPTRTPPVLKGLDDPHASVRAQAIEASASLPIEQVSGALLEIISRDTSPSTRVAAVNRFAEASTDLKVRAAERALRTHVTEARVAAVELLTGKSDPELGLLARALHDPEVEVAEKAIGLLGSLGATEALAVLWSSLRLVGPEIQELILAAMERFDRDAVFFLGRQALDSPDPSDRVLGLGVLSRLEGEDPTERLSVALADPAPEVRIEALQNLLRHPDPEVVHHIGTRLRDPEPTVRALALEVLDAIDDDRTLPYFVDGAKDPAPEVRRAAKDALLRHSSDAVIELLLRALRFPTHRRAAADLLVEFGRPAVDHLTAALPKADGEVHRIIGEVLRDTDAQTMLVERLLERDASRRLLAVKGLGAIRSQLAVPHLIERLRDPDASVRAETARVLGAIGDQRAIEPLKQAFIGDPDMEVVRAIEPALRRLTEDR